MRLKWPKSCESHEGQFPKLNVLIGQKWILRHYCIQKVKYGLQIRVYRINKEIVTHFSKCISAKATKILRKSQAQLWEKLRKLRRGSGKTMYFLLKTTCTSTKKIIVWLVLSNAWHLLLRGGISVDSTRNE